MKLTEGRKEKARQSDLPSQCCSHSLTDDAAIEMFSQLSNENPPSRPIW